MISLNSRFFITLNQSINLNFTNPQSNFESYLKNDCPNSTLASA